VENEKTRAIFASSSKIFSRDIRAELVTPASIRVESPGTAGDLAARRRDATGDFAATNARSKRRPRFK
jgi:hypothetical protein